MRDTRLGSLTALRLPLGDKFRGDFNVCSCLTFGLIMARARGDKAEGRRQMDGEIDLHLLPSWLVGHWPTIIECPPFRHCHQAFNYYFP